MICLDTNAVIAAILERPAMVRARLKAVLAGGGMVAVSAIVLHEMWYGVAKSSRPAANAAALGSLFGLGLERWPFDEDDAREAGEIRAALARAGTPIGPYDLLIAGQARRRGAVLVTANTKEFARVPGLKTEDWAVA
jgi:tRNA(fMet)-specific endonuclease VapC